MEINEHDDDGNAERKRRLKRILSDGAPQKPKAPRRRASTQKGHSINGDNNIIGNGNTINYGEPKIISKVHVQTGVGTITAAQKRQINDMFSEWARVRGFVRKTNAEYKSLRAAFNKHMNVNKYDEIKEEDFDKAIKWLRRQAGIILSMPSARKKVPDWRIKRYASINARAKEFPDGVDRYRRYAQENFGTGSLKELDDDQLDAVYQYVFGWRR